MPFTLPVFLRPCVRLLARSLIHSYYSCPLVCVAKVHCTYVHVCTKSSAWTRELIFWNALCNESDRRAHFMDVNGKILEDMNRVGNLTSDDLITCTGIYYTVVFAELKNDVYPFKSLVIMLNLKGAFPILSTFLEGGKIKSWLLWWSLLLIFKMITFWKINEVGL